MNALTSKVAIKKTLFTDDNYRKAFSREARLLNSLKHTVLPKVSDTFIDGNGQYIVMEFISGEDLFEMLELSGEVFPLEDSVIWAEHEYLHGQENPVIHRDIKPQNLKLTPQGQVILLDFGLAKGNPTDANHHTAANSIFGYSRNYASLEQIQGTGTDPRSDIYSLAATLYHLLTGKPPADALTRVMMVLNEDEDPLQPANLTHEQVPEDLANYLQEAMSLNANLRLQSATEMRELLSAKQKTSVTTRPKTHTNKAVGTNLYIQNTKVFDENEQLISDSKRSNIKTEILPIGSVAGISVETVVGNPIRTYRNRLITNKEELKVHRFSSKKLIMAVGLGALLLIGTFASAIYLSSDQPTLIDNAVIDNSNLETNSELVNPDTTNENINSNLTAETFEETPLEMNPNDDLDSSGQKVTKVNNGSGENNTRSKKKIDVGVETITMGDGSIFIPNPDGAGVILVPKAVEEKITDKKIVEEPIENKTQVNPKKPVEKPSEIET